MAKRNRDYDTIIVGGGPAGATTATVLAQKGRRVLLLERERFPRYHIGESLMPYTWFSFERLGVLDWLKRTACPRKYSVQFVSTTGKTSKPFYFYQTINHECAVTWQVLRSEFDTMMLANAQQKGAEVRHGVAVRELITEGGRATGVRADVKGGGSAVFHAGRSSTQPAATRSLPESSGGSSVTAISTRCRYSPTSRERVAIPDSTKAPRPSPTSRTRVGSGTSRWQTMS